MINIRASMLPSACDCMKRAIAGQFRNDIKKAGFILKEREPIIGGAVGTAVHDGSEYTIKQLLLTGSHASKNDCIEVGMKTFKEEIKDGTIWDSTTTSGNEAEKQISNMVNSFYLQIAPSVQPASMPEKKYELQIGNDIIFTGSSDIEEINNDLHDIKTGVMLRSYQAQQGGYSILRQHAKGLIAGKLIIDYLPRVSTRKAYPGATQKIYNRDTCEKLAFYTIIRIAEIMRQFYTDYNSDKIPCNPMSMLCSDKFCTAYGTKFCRLG